MREIRSYGSVGVRGGNEPHYPECKNWQQGERKGCRPLFQEGIQDQ